MHDEHPVDPLWVHTGRQCEIRRAPDCGASAQATGNRLFAGREVFNLENLNLKTEWANPAFICWILI